MIALPDKLPLIEWKDGRYIPLSEGWLVESMEASLGEQEEAGELDLEALVYSLTHFLKDQPQGTTVAHDDLVRLMRKSLRAFGHEHLSENVHLVSPRVTIHLTELASRNSIELAFFDALQEKLEEAIGSVVRGIRLEGIRDSVKVLHNARRWKKNCQVLNDEIVLFSRQTIEKTNQPLIDLVIS